MKFKRSKALRRIAILLIVCVTITTLSVGGVSAQSDSNWSDPSSTAGTLDPSQDLSGSGTESDPYVITNDQEFQSIRNDLDAHYILANNINASKTDQWYSGDGFEPIRGDFTGSLDGKGYEIKGLYMDRDGGSENTHAIMADATDAEITDISITEVNFTVEYGGVIVYFSDNVDMSNVDVSGSIAASESSGVVTNYLDGGSSIDNITSDVDVSAVSGATPNLGGLIGSHGSSSTIENAIVKGDVNADGSSSAGGINYVMDSGATADDIIYVGDVTYDGSAGDGDTAISAEDRETQSGNDDPREIYYSDVYWDTDVNTQTDPWPLTDKSGVTGLTTSEMQGSTAETNMNLDFQNDWETQDGDYPILQVELPSVVDLRVEIDGNVDSYTIVGPETFSTDAYAIYDDGSEEEVTDNSTFTITSGNSVYQISNTFFEGVDSGDSVIEGVYEGFTDDITVTVEDPPKPESIEMYEDAPPDAIPGEINKSESVDIYIELTDEDNETESVTFASDVTVSNSTVLNYTDSDVSVTGEEYGDSNINATYYDEWYNTNLTANASVTVLGDLASLEIDVNPKDNFRRDRNSTYESTAIYEDGREKDVTNDTDYTLVGNGEINESENKILYNEAGNYTFSGTYSETTETGLVIETDDSLDIYVDPLLQFEDYQKLSTSERILITIWDSEFLTLLIGLTMATGLTMKVGLNVGAGSLGLFLIVAWLLGFASTFMLITFSIFGVFGAYIYSDLNVYQIASS